MFVKKDFYHFNLLIYAVFLWKIHHLVIFFFLVCFQVQSILKRKADLLEVTESNPSNERKRLCHTSPQEELNVLMWEWFQKVRSMGIPVYGPMFQEIALSFAKNLGIKEDEF